MLFDHLRLAPPDRVVCPVLSLPPEITAKIFRRCIPFGSPITPSPLHAPMVLLHVCRAWRALALSTPVLWTSLDLDVAQKKGKSIPELALSWLSRSGSLPISLRLSGSTPLEFDRVNAILREHALRLQHLTLLLDWEDFFKLSDLGPLPSLSTLTLGNAAQLHTVNIKFGVYPRMFALPWGQLTHFFGEGLLVVQCLQLLRDCPQLKQCRFHLIYCLEDVDTGAVHHASLEELAMSGAANKLVHALHLPALHTLALTEPLFDAQPNCFPPFLARIASSLRTFSYIDDPPSHHGPSIDASFLRPLHALSSVLFTGAVFFGFAAVLSDDDAFLPQLRTLTITDVHRRFFVDAGVLAALRARKVESLRLVYHFRLL
ncbi:hypothetical protein C8R43DRAFT_1126419 [Mycena crocata]|nr:hypothetical protein C8R43DRAFT_1126419 [Mycena crocata]